MATADWNQLDDVFYRKTEIYSSMLWNDVRLDLFVVAASIYGGPIAMVRNSMHAVMHTGCVSAESEALRSKMRIYNSAGQLLSAFPWTFGNLLYLAWTADERLLAVLSDGIVLLYNIAGQQISAFSMGPMCKENGVSECFSWEKGLLVRVSQTNQLFAVMDVSEPTPNVIELPSPQLTVPPSSMCIVSPRQGSDLIIHISTSECMYSVNAISYNIVNLPSLASVNLPAPTSADGEPATIGPFTKMVVSPSGNLVACFSSSGVLFVLPPDFSKVVSHFDAKTRISPHSIAWCGEDSILLYWDTILLMIGPFGDFIKYTYNSYVHLVSEIDGVRIITDNSYEWLQRVPDSAVEIFKIGSTAPAAMLFDAAEAFQDHNADADEKLRSVGDAAAIANAVDVCLDAASAEITPSTQLSLIKAASFGKLFAEDYDVETYVELCRILRVLNAIRQPNIGIPLTFVQLQAITPLVLIARLVERHQHLLALRICKYIRLSPVDVLIHWAKHKILSSASLSDEDLCQLVRKKLEDYPKISFAEIAKTAYEMNRLNLATKLLEYEPLVANQVPLLMSINQHELALVRALESGDTDLIYMSLLHLYDTLPEKDFFLMIHDKPLASRLFVQYCKQSDLNLLTNFYYHTRRPVDAANVAVIQAYKSTTWVDRMKAIEIAQEFFSKNSTDPLLYKLTANQIQLLRFEREMDLNSSNPAYIDMSLGQLIEKCIHDSQYARAEKLRQAFNVPEAWYWHIQIRTLAKCSRWEELTRLAESPKGSPIGYLPFVEACFEQKATVEAFKYIEKLSDAHLRMEWLCDIGYWKEAADVAYREKDFESLLMIRDKCGKPAVENWISRQLLQAK